MRINNIWILYSAQKGFVTGPLGSLNIRIYSLLAIMEDTATYKKTIMMSSLDLKNAFGSV